MVSTSAGSPKAARRTARLPVTSNLRYGVNLRRKLAARPRRSTTAERIPLTRPRVLDAALDLVGRDGLEALSMRRLGAALGVEAMSLYRYVPTKAALLDGMVERMLEGLRVPEGGLDPARWREEARASLERLREIALAHPRAFPLVATRAVASYVAGREVAETYLRMLIDAGFAPETAATAQRALLRYAIGFALGDIAAEPGAAPAPGGSPVDATIAEVAAGRSDAAFAFGLELMLSGLEDVLARERRRGPGA